MESSEKGGSPFLGEKVKEEALSDAEDTVAANAFSVAPNGACQPQTLMGQQADSGVFSVPALEPRKQYKVLSFYFPLISFQAQLPSTALDFFFGSYSNFLWDTLPSFASLPHPIFLHSVTVTCHYTFHLLFICSLFFPSTGV